MKITILTLFPEIISQLRNYGVIGRAIRKENIKLNIVNIRDYANNPQKKVDDAPYGGGAGMLMQCEPIAAAIRDHSSEDSHIIYLSPQGPVLNQEKAKSLALKEDLILLCGHYEGIDERIVDELIDEEISIGDYILTGGELGAMVLVDVVGRYLEDTVGSFENVNEDTLSNGLLKYPQYTRPEIWEGKAVPKVLLSGHHEKINSYREKESIRITKDKRPDLLKNKNK